MPYRIGIPPSSGGGGGGAVGSFSVDQNTTGQFTVTESSSGSSFTVPYDEVIELAAATSLPVTESLGDGLTGRYLNTSGGSIVLTPDTGYTFAGFSTGVATFDDTFGGTFNVNDQTLTLPDNASCLVYRKGTEIILMSVSSSTSSGSSTTQTLTSEEVTIVVTSALASGTVFNVNTAITGTTLSGDTAISLGTAASTFQSSTFEVNLNGIEQDRTADAVWASAATFMLNSAVVPGDEITVQRRTLA